MTTVLILVACMGLLALAGFLAIRTGLARRAFFALYARVKGDDLLGPAVLHNPPVNSPYLAWLERARKTIPVFDGGVLHDAGSIDLHSWPQLGDGVSGLYLRLADNHMIDGTLFQIPAHGKTTSQRHLYEKGIYFLSGTGYINLRKDGQSVQRIDWGPGDLFSVPLNVQHEIHNTGEVPARILAVSSFPLVLNLLNNTEFIENNVHAFTDRYDGAADFPESTHELARLELSANFVKDIRHTEIRRNDFRGKGNKSIRWLMAGNSMLSMHISELPPRMRKMAHRISSNAIVLVLSGEGVTALWREGAWKKRVRIEWKPGTVFAPPVFWYQQHLNWGRVPARYLAINVPNFVRNIGLHFEDQIEVDATEIASDWERELEKKESTAH